MVWVARSLRQPDLQTGARFAPANDGEATTLTTVTEATVSMVMPGRRWSTGSRDRPGTFASGDHLLWPMSAGQDQDDD